MNRTTDAATEDSGAPRDPRGGKPERRRGAPQADRVVSKLSAGLLRSYQVWNTRTRGWLSVFVRAWNRFGSNRGPESAAAVAFFSIFSVIPLFVFVMQAASAWIARSVVQQTIARFLDTAFPVSLEGLMAIINPLFGSAGSLGIIATLGFLWAASNMFSILLLGINRSWPSRKSGSRMRNRLIALAFVTALAVLVTLVLMLALGVRLVTGLLPQSRGSLAGILVPLAVQVLVVYCMYRFGPSAQVSTSSCMLGAAIATLAIDIVTRGFGWYLNSELSFYSVYYGSLGAIIGLLFWVYLCCYILLYGSYLTEAIHTRANAADPSRFVELPSAG